MAIVTRKA